MPVSWQSARHKPGGIVVVTLCQQWRKEPAGSLDKYPSRAIPPFYHSSLPSPSILSLFLHVLLFAPLPSLTTISNLFLALPSLPPLITARMSGDDNSSPAGSCGARPPNAFCAIHSSKSANLLKFHIRDDKTVRLGFGSVAIKHSDVLLFSL